VLSWRPSEFGPMRNYLPDSKDNFNVHSSSISKSIGLLWAPMDLSVQMGTRDVDTRTPCSCYFASSLPFYGLLPACFQLSGITLRYTLWYTSLPCVSVSCVCVLVLINEHWTTSGMWMGWDGVELFMNTSAFYIHGVKRTQGENWSIHNVWTI